MTDERADEIAVGRLREVEDPRALGPRRLGLGGEGLLAAQLVVEEELRRVSLAAHRYRSMEIRVGKPSDPRERCQRRRHAP